MRELEETVTEVMAELVAVVASETPRLLALALLALLAVAETPGRDDPASMWESLGETPAVAFFYSPLTVVGKAGGVKVVQMRLEYRGDTPEGRAARARMTSQTTAAFEGRPVTTVVAGVISVEIDCAKRVYRNGHQSLYGEGDTPIEEAPGDANAAWERPVAGSAHEALLEAACGDAGPESPAVRAARSSWREAGSGGHPASRSTSRSLFAASRMRRSVAPPNPRISPCLGAPPA